MSVPIESSAAASQSHRNRGAARTMACLLLSLALLLSLWTACAVSAAAAGGTGDIPCAHLARAALSGRDRTVYDLLEKEIVAIARGARTDTSITFTVGDLGLTQGSWTAQQLGVASVYKDGGIPKDAQAAMTAQVNFDLYHVLRALMADHPYELYWYDKTRGSRVSYDFGIGLLQQGGVYRLAYSGQRRITVRLMVAKEYAANPQSSVDRFAIDPQKLAACKVNQALETARQIVAANASRSDLDKLQAYRQAICDSTAYDAAAGDASKNVPYGNPWQVISVFDGDPATNSICEGYAKAFQLLCDLSTFSGDVQCRSVGGTLVSDAMRGAHMWNLVRLGDGKTYLVDLTNCDSSTLGYPDKLFLRGYDERISDGYRINLDNRHAMTYSYDADTRMLFSDSTLALCDARTSGSPASSGESGAGTNADSQSAEKTLSTAGKTRFRDVRAADYYADAVDWAVKNGITNGTATDTFSPSAPCTRAQVVTFLWRAVGKPQPAARTNPFSDVADGSYYRDAVLWAVENGITNGTSAVTFAPEATCTRAQVATFLHRAKGSPQPGGRDPFVDLQKDGYYYDAVLWAVENGITNGTSAVTFAPEATCTRAQIVTFLYRALGQ